MVFRERFAPIIVPPPETFRQCRQEVPTAIADNTELPEPATMTYLTLPVKASNAIVRVGNVSVSRWLISWLWTCVMMRGSHGYSYRGE